MLSLNLKPSRGTLRQFAGAWLIFFLAIGLHQSLVRHHSTAGAALMAAAVLFGVLGLARPAVIRWLFVTCTIIAFPLGWVVSQLALALMFYGLVTPLALWFRFRGRDALNRRPAPEASSFWTEKTTPSDMRRYFRQY